jgi:hypothetical protein
VKRLNSHPSSSQHKRNKSKWYQNDKSSHTRKGGEEEREEQKHKSQRTHHKLNPGGHEKVKATIPTANFGSYTNSLICGPLSQETQRGGKNLGKEEAK